MKALNLLLKKAANNIDNNKHNNNNLLLPMGISIGGAGVLGAGIHGSLLENPEDGIINDHKTNIEMAQSNVDWAKNRLASNKTRYENEKKDLLSDIETAQNNISEITNKMFSASGKEFKRLEGQKFTNELNLKDYKKRLNEMGEKFDETPFLDDIKKYEEELKSHQDKLNNYLEGFKKTPTQQFLANHHGKLIGLGALGVLGGVYGIHRNNQNN